MSTLVTPCHCLHNQVKRQIRTFLDLASERVLWLMIGLKAHLYVNRVEMNPQRYSKEMEIIVCNAGKNVCILTNKAVVQLQAEEPRSYGLLPMPSPYCSGLCEI